MIAAGIQKFQDAVGGDALAYVISEEIGHNTERKHCHIAYKGKA